MQAQGNKEKVVTVPDKGGDDPVSTCPPTITYRYTRAATRATILLSTCPQLPRTILARTILCYVQS